MGQFTSYGTLTTVRTDDILLALDVNDTTMSPAGTTKQVTVGALLSGTAATALDWLNVKSYGATGNGTTDDTAAFNSAGSALSAAGGGVIYVPTGTYKLTAALPVYNNMTVQGDGPSSTLHMTATNAPVYFGGTGNINRLSFRDLTLLGPGTAATAAGIFLGNSSGVPYSNLAVERVGIQSFGGQGIYVDTPITSFFQDVEVQGCGGNGFELTSTTTVGTSVHMYSCYVNHCFGTYGYAIFNMNYSSLNNCACDSPPTDGYVFGTCSSVALTGCGCEVAGNFAYLLQANSTMSLTSCYSLSNANSALFIQNGDGSSTITGFREIAPSGTHPSIVVSTGCTSVVINPQVTNAASYGASTSYVITSAGGTVH